MPWYTGFGSDNKTTAREYSDTEILIFIFVVWFLGMFVGMIGFV